MSSRVRVDDRQAADRLARSRVLGERLARPAEFEHVRCNVSGLVTEAHWRRWSVEDLRPYIGRVADWVGEDPLIFGSEWLVCTLAASHDEVVRACEDALGELVDSAREKIFGGDAVVFYGLGT